MTRKPLQFVHEFRDRHGKIRRYFRRPGYKSVALPGSPFSPEFVAAYTAAMAGEPAPQRNVAASRSPQGSVNAAIVAYYTDPTFTDLAAGTRKMRRAILENFRQDQGATGVPFGERSIRTLPADKLATFIKAKKPWARRNWLKTLRGLFRFAVVETLRPDDPTKDIKLTVVKTKGYHSWTEAEIAQYEARHPIGSRPRLAMALLLYTCQRRSDVVRMGAQHRFLKDGLHYLRVRQQKTGTELEIRLHPALIRILDKTPAGMTYLLTEAGKPFSAAGFGNLFKDWCREAELPDNCASHGLRKASCRRLAEAGSTAPEIMANSGHKSLAEAQSISTQPIRRC
jgi:integrase